MSTVRATAILLGCATVAALAGCAGAPTQPAMSTPATVPASAAPPVAVAPQFVPDAVPRIEPRSRYGNPPFYDVFGKRYYVLSSSSGYVERGVASWYGPGFHQVRTSTGEPYDMYAMTAAHRTLPLPAYARVTNLQNGRSVVVRINDRGPFVGNRIIDLSYSAAVRLDMLRHGTAMVEVSAIDPAAPAMAQPAPPDTTLTAAAPAGTAPAGTAPASEADAPPAVRGALFVQAGAFADPANAERLAGRLRDASLGKIFVRDDFIAGRHLYRVRIGPVPDVSEFDHIVAALEQRGVHDAHLALD